METTSQQQAKAAYTFAMEPSGFEATYVAASEGEARQMFWDGLSESAKDSCESFDCVEQVAA